jgi:hypothetical protein
MNQELTDKTKQIALNNGADLVGVVDIDSLDEHSEDIHKILPQAKNVIVVAAKHSLAAIQSNNIQMGQFDTIRGGAPDQSVSGIRRLLGSRSSCFYTHRYASAEEGNAGRNLLAPSRRKSRVGFLRRKRLARHA